MSVLVSNPSCQEIDISRLLDGYIGTKEDGIMSTSDVSETVLQLLDSGRISWPRSVSDRNKFIAENFGKVWDALLDINIHANLEVFSHLDDELASTSLYGTCESASGTAWGALGQVLMLVLVLEDALGIDITFSPTYGAPNDFSIEKAKIRLRVRS
jgi:hypothetical protein